MGLTLFGAGRGVVAFADGFVECPMRRPGPFAAVAAPDDVADECQFVAGRGVSRGVLLAWHDGL